GRAADHHVEDAGVASRHYIACAPRQMLGEVVSYCQLLALTLRLRPEDNDGGGHCGRDRHQRRRECDGARLQAARTAEGGKGWEAQVHRHSSARRTHAREGDLNWFG